MPFDGSLGFFSFAPANCAKAISAPPMSALYWFPNGPWQLDRIPILIGLAADLPTAPAAKTAAVTAVAARKPSPAGSQNRRPRSLTYVMWCPPLWSCLRDGLSLVDRVSEAFRATALCIASFHPAGGPIPASAPGGANGERPKVPRPRLTSHSQIPSRPPGDRRTMTRKIAPMIVLKLPPMAGIDTSWV